MAGAKMKDHVEHEERPCTKHGRTLFACTIVGRASSKHWYCMKCDSERALARYHAIKDGTYEPKRVINKIKPPREYGQCDKHFLAKNALGKCMGCED